MVERHVFNAPTSKQPVEKLANRHTVAAHVVAARGVRTRLAFPANYRWNKMPFNLCGSLSSWCGVQNDHLLHTRPLIGIKQQAQAAHLFPQQHTVLALCRCCCKLLLLLTVACRTNLYHSDSSFEISRSVGWRTEILARQAGKGHLFLASSEN